MEFVENNRISHRQLYRQIVLTFTGPFLLCLFGQQKILGIAGVLGTAAAMLILVFYVIFLVRLAPFYGDLRKSAGKMGAWVIGVFFLSYILLTGAYLLSVLEAIVPEGLLIGVPGKWISFFAVIVCGFGTHKGLQRRGRAAEVSGAICFGAVLVMIALCLGQVKASYFLEMTNRSVVTLSSFTGSTYGMLCAFSGIGLLPFVLEHVEKNKSAGKSVIWGLLTIGGLIIVMLLILPAVFGWERLKKELYPVLPLLAGADLPGNVLARFDVLWMGFILYSLLFAIGSLLSYGHQIIRKANLGTGRFWLMAAIYVLSLTEMGGWNMQKIYSLYLAYIFVPGLLILQFIAASSGKGKRKKTAAAIALSGLLFLSGCSGVDPEKRLYPLALGVDASENGVEVTYAMPDLSQSTGQEKPEEGSEKVLSITGTNFTEIDAFYDRSQEKYLDMGHMQVLVLGKQLIDRRQWDETLNYLKQEPFLGENIYVFKTENVKELLEWRGDGNISVGEYVIGLMENSYGIKKNKGVTLRQVYQKWYDSGELLNIPLLILENNKIQVLEE